MNKMKTKKVVLVPAGNKIVVEVRQDEYKGLIHIPDAAKEKPTQGVILSVGPGLVDTSSPLPSSRQLRFGTTDANAPVKVNRIPVQFKPGDVVMFSKYGGTELKLDSKDLRVISEDEILCKIEEVS